MSKKNIIARVGNFEITKDGGSEHDYLRIKSVSGHWGVTYRDDNEMYGKIMAMVNEWRAESGERRENKHLEFYILHIYYTTNIVIDEQFGLDFMIALEAMRDRMAKAQGEPTEEEEAEAIKEAEVMEDIKNTLINQ